MWTILSPAHSGGLPLTRGHGIQAFECAVEDTVFVPGLECLGEAHGHMLIVQWNSVGDVHGGEIRF